MNQRDKRGNKVDLTSYKIHFFPQMHNRAKRSSPGYDKISVIPHIWPPRSWSFTQKVQSYSGVMNRINTTRGGRSLMRNRPKSHRPSKPFIASEIGKSLTSEGGCTPAARVTIEDSIRCLCFRAGLATWPSSSAVSRYLGKMRPPSIRLYFPYSIVDTQTIPPHVTWIRLPALSVDCGTVSLRRGFQTEFLRTCTFTAVPAVGVLYSLYVAMRDANSPESHNVFPPDPHQPLPEKSPRPVQILQMQ